MIVCLYVDDLIFTCNIIKLFDNSRELWQTSLKGMILGLWLTLLAPKGSNKKMKFSISHNVKAKKILEIFDQDGWLQAS